MLIRTKLPVEMQNIDIDMSLKLKFRGEIIGSINSRDMTTIEYKLNKKGISLMKKELIHIPKLQCGFSMDIPSRPYIDKLLKKENISKPHVDTTLKMIDGILPKITLIPGSR